MNQQQQIRAARGVFIFNRRSGNSVETSVSLTAHVLGLKSEQIREWYEAGHFYLDSDPEAVIEEWQAESERLEDDGAGDAPEAAWEKVNR